jgi:guanylate kinase
MGNILTVSGPRGVGKSAAMRDLGELHGIRPIVPYATRDMRLNEVNGVDYRFVDHDTFNRLRHERPMFDVLDLKGNQYGTPLLDLEDVIDREGPDVLRSINLAANSAIQLRRQLGSNAVRSVFILPASWQDIEMQMREKGTSEAEIQDRRSKEPTDLTLLPEFDQIVVNQYGCIDDTVEQIATFAQAAFHAAKVIS